MSARLRVASALVLAAGCAARRPVWPPGPSDWREVRSAPCGFTIRMPGRTRSREETDRRGIHMTAYSVALRPGYVYMALCASGEPSREGEAGETFVRERLQAERAAIERQGWRVDEARFIRVGTCPASEMVSVNHDGIEFRTRFVWAGDRGIFLGASGPAAEGTRETAAAMFDSFHADRCGGGGVAPAPPGPGSGRDEP